MIRTSIGIDTSVLVRLVTGDPPDIHSHCVEALNELVANGVEVFASNQVIGEAYITAQHHYGVNRDEARSGSAKCTDQWSRRSAKRPGRTRCPGSSR